MGFDPHEPEQRGKLNDALRAAGISVGELWLRYFSMSGSAGEYEVQAYAQGLISLPVAQRDLLAMAANELIDEKPQLRAPYADELDSFSAEAGGQDTAQGCTAPVAGFQGTIRGGAFPARTVRPDTPAGCPGPPRPGGNAQAS
ncbi:hypothetical protein [Pseudarthrobacter sp. WHRI 8279]|uniref:hypothetical protein n=1 Tax=Pseudarthrobacter sp. WHRI 8279 TaxID=3162566 RepID=UPI0032EFA7FF